MAALVQAYPQQSSTITMIQSRPSSASGILQNSSQNPSHHQYASNSSQTNRHSFHGALNNNVGNGSYRGNTIAPYAFTSTPGLAMPGQRTQSSPHLRNDQRTSSAPIVPTAEGGTAGNRLRYPAPASISTTSSSSSSDLSSLSHKSGSRDDSTLPGTSRVSSVTPRPHSTIFTTSSSPNLALPPSISATTVKPSPERYRRPNNRRAESVPNIQQSNSQASVMGSAMPNVMQFYGSSTQSTPSVNSLQSFNVQMPPSRQPHMSVDDMQINRSASQEQAKRYRRRSIHTIEPSEFSYDGGNSIAAGLQKQGSRQVSSANGRIDQQQHPLRSSPTVAFRPTTSHGRNDSSESVNSLQGSSRPGSVSLTAISQFPSRTPILYH